MEYKNINLEKALKIYDKVNREFAEKIEKKMEKLKNINISNSLETFEKAAKVLDDNIVPERQRTIIFTNTSKKGYEKWIGGKIKHNEITNGVKFINADKSNFKWTETESVEIKKINNISLMNYERNKNK